MDIASRISHTCCFLGHREICTTEDLTARLRQTIEELIVQKDVDTFLFGSKSAFNSLCYRLVTEIKHKFPHIKRVYIRAEYPLIDDGYTAYLLER